MFCKFCGKEIPEKLTSAGFCLYCGKSLTEPQNSSPEISHAPDPLPENLRNGTGHTSRNSKKIIKIFAATVGFLLLLAFLAHLGQQPETQPETPLPTTENQASPPVYPDYHKSAVPTSVEDFLFTPPIPVSLRSQECGIIVFPQRTFLIQDSLRAGLDFGSLFLNERNILTEEAKKNVPVCDRAWITVSGQSKSYFLDAKDIAAWIKVRDTFSDRISSRRIAEPDDWVAALWRKTLSQTAATPEILAELSGDNDVLFLVELGAKPARLLDNPDQKKVLVNEETGDPLAEQERKTLNAAQGEEDLLESALWDALKNVNFYYTLDEFHQTAAIAREADSLLVAAQHQAASGQLVFARDQILRAQQLREGLQSTLNAWRKDNRKASQEASSEKPLAEPADSLSADEVSLRSVVAARGYQPIGNVLLVSADLEGKKLLIQRAACNNVPDQHCQKLFIAFNDRFLGTDTSLPSWAVHDVAQERVGAFSAVYEDLSDPNKRLPPVRVVYTWDGQRLTASGTPPTRPSNPASASNK